MNILEYENTQETKSHGNLEFPFNIYPCSIPLDFSAVPVHWHNDMEIIYVKRGRGKISVDLVPYTVEKGDIILVSPGQLHSIEQLDSCIMEYENIIFQPGLLLAAPNDLCTEQFISPLMHRRLTLPACIKPRDALYAEISECLNDIDCLSGQKSSRSMLGIKGRLFCLLYYLFSIQQIRSPRAGVKSLDTLKLILKHVETHYQEKISIRDIAGVTGFSCSHFMKFFKQNMGVSFIEYLNDYRLTMAARMLTVSSETVVAIAEETGFENLSYFNRLFKNKYGTTPSRFRNRSTLPQVSGRRTAEETHSGRAVIR